MKLLVFVSCLLFCSHVFSQEKKGGYFSLRGGVSIKDDLKKGVGHLSIGISPNHTFGVGAGIGFLEFEKPYIPLTIDISFFGKPGKISPVVIGSAGYGVYQYKNLYGSIRGGFTGSLNFGVALPMKKYSKFFITGGYSIYSFNGGTNIMTTGDSFYKEGNIKMFTATAGIKI